MANENKPTGNSQSSGQQGSSSQQQATFNEKNYNDDPNNMANYTGNYGTGTYDTDYGAGEFPKTNAKEQGGNWVDKTGATDENNSKQKDGQNSSGNQ